MGNTTGSSNLPLSAIELFILVRGSPKSLAWQGIRQNGLFRRERYVHRYSHFMGYSEGDINPLSGEYPMPLTDTALRAAKPPTSRKSSLMATAFSFHLPHGTQSWRVKYHFQGREKLLTLGTYPQLSLKEAREACIAAKKQVSGVDPEAEKRLRAKSLQTTFEAVAREWHANQTAIWTENYAKDVMERVAKNILGLS